jgi:hypothetical protein
MASNLKYAGTDLDDIFKPIGTYDAGSDTGFKVAGTDIANRYAPSQVAGDKITYNVGFKVGGTDLSQTFMDINCPDVTLTGPSSVTAGSFNGEFWPFTANSSFTITGVRFYIVDHGLGNWASVSTNSYSGDAFWADPFANPSISNSPGTYNYIFEAMDENQLVGHVDIYVEVL